MWLLRGHRARFAAALGVLAVASFVDGWFLVGHNFDRAYYGTDARALEFLVGAIVAVALFDATLGRRASRVAAGFGVVGFGVVAWQMAYARTGQVGLFRGGFLVYALASSRDRGRRVRAGTSALVCSLAPLRALGRVSYGTYIFHWPVFLLLTSARIGIGGLPLFAVRLAVTIGLATLSYVLIECPIREGRRLVGRRSWIFAPAGAAFVGVAAVVDRRRARRRRARRRSSHPSSVRGPRRCIRPRRHRFPARRGPRPRTGATDHGRG